MFQMATKYKGTYYKAYNSTPVKDVRQQAVRLGNSISRLARHVLHSTLGQLDKLIKEMET